MMRSAQDMLDRAGKIRDEKSERFAGLRFDYEYPMDMDLRPGSEVSTRILRMVTEGIAESRPITDRMTESWKKMEWTQRAYMPADDWDTKVKQKDPRRPINIVVPQTFSLREMYQTYFFYKFFRGGIIHRIRPVGGGVEQIVKAGKMERIIAKQSAWFNEGLTLDMAVGDAFTYGTSVIALDWTKTVAERALSQNLGAVDAAVLAEIYGESVEAGDPFSDIEEETVEEGSKARVLDIRQCFFDRNVSSNECQESEYFGYSYATNAMKLLKREQDPEEYVFNAKYVRELARGGRAGSVWWNREDGRGADYGSQYEDFSASQETSRVHVQVWFQEIIPNEVFGIGGDTPEKWVFGVAGDTVIIHASRLNLRHRMWPVAWFSPNANGHDTLCISHLMAQYGLQSIADKYINTKVNLEATSVNGMIAFDPTKVNEDDMMNPGPGKRLRVRNAAYNEGGIERYILQLRTEARTDHYMPDAMLVGRMAEEGLGLNQSMLGRLEGLPERPTAGGISSAQQIGFSRLDMLGSRFYDQVLKPLGKMHIYNNVQFLDIDIAVEIAGRYEQVLRQAYGMDGESVVVKPGELDTNMDIEPYNKAMSLVRNAEGMNEFMKVVFAQPEALGMLLQEYRISGIFQAWLQEMGFENAAEFKMPQGVQPIPQMNVQSMPDEQMQGQIQAGNMVGLGNAA